MAKNLAPPLKNSLSSRGNVAYLDDPSKFDKSKRSVILVGASWCHFSRLGAGKLDEACKDIKNGKCYLADVTDPACEKAIEKIGISSDRYPDHFVWNPKSKAFSEIVGMRDVPSLKKELTSKGFKF